MKASNLPEPAGGIERHQGWAPQGTGLSWTACALLAIFGCLLFLPGFFTLPPIDRDEARFTQATRQMLESRDFVDIRFQEATRYKKPIGIHWLQAASVTLWQAATGVTQTQVIWPYRVPSLIAAVTSVVLTAAIGARLFGTWAGLAAGVLLALSVVLNLEARMATTDAALLACTLSVHYVLAVRYCGSREGDAPLKLGELFMGWGGLGLGILIKGPIILIFTVGTLLGLALQRVDLRWLRQLRLWTGLGLVSLMVVPWLVLISMRSHGAFWQESVGHDLLGKVLDAETAGRSPPGAHALMFWIGFWPGSIVVLLAGPWVWAHRRDHAVRFCLAWVVPAWIVFELPMTKLFHYLLPAYPGLAMLGAAWLAAGAEPSWSSALRRTAIAIWSVITVAACCALTVAQFYANGRVVPEAALLGLLGAVAIFAAYFLTVRRPIPALGMLAVSGLALMLQLGIVVPGLKTAFISRNILAAIPLSGLCSKLTLVSAGYEEPSLVFLGPAGVRFMSGATAADAIASAPCVVAAVEKHEQSAFLQRSMEIGHTPQPISTVDGVNYTNSRWMTITLYASSEPKGEN